MKAQISESSKYLISLHLNKSSNIGRDLEALISVSQPLSFLWSRKCLISSVATSSGSGIFKFAQKTAWKRCFFFLAVNTQRSFHGTWAFIFLIIINLKKKWLNCISVKKIIQIRKIKDKSFPFVLLRNLFHVKTLILAKNHMRFHILIIW